jgi:mRNA interferase MazF
MHFEIYWADLNPIVGREQAGHRPVLIISNEIENLLDIVTVIPITTRKTGRRVYPNELLFTLRGNEAILLCHQVRAISKKRLNKKMGTLDKNLKTHLIKILCNRFS